MKMRGGFLLPAGQNLIEKRGTCMQYSSTRNNQIHVSASQAISRGISPEGGLFVPTELPVADDHFLRELLPLSYPERAKRILALFLTDFSADEIAACADSAYGNQFDTPSIAPLRVLGDSAYMLELWHGPTCAFKDMALQILPHFMRTAVKKAAPGEKTVILVATSGDTGKAALEGFKNVPDTKILVFYPSEGVSEMQRLQMVTQDGDNVGVCALRGNFDDAQTGVKALFTDPAMNATLEKHGMRFSSANSINWGRLLPQIVYYFSAYCSMVQSGAVAMGQPINVVVPTGNFGNILAAYYAGRMGVPLHKLVCASNANRVLTDFFETGVYDCNRPFYTTTSPSMDILVSSNLERLLYHLSGENCGALCSWMKELKMQRRYAVPAAVKEQMDARFAAGSATDAQVAETIRRVFADKHYLCDTHTAVAVRVYEEYRDRTGDATPTVIASTASPYKFAPAILSALGAAVPAQPYDQLEALQRTTGTDIPHPLAALRGKAVRFTDECAGDIAGMQQTVCQLLRL